MSEKIKIYAYAIRGTWALKNPEADRKWHVEVMLENFQTDSIETINFAVTKIPDFIELKQLNAQTSEWIIENCKKEIERLSALF